MSGQVVDVVIASTSPSLQIRERSGGTQLPAKVISGSSYTPVVGDTVAAAFVRGRYWIIGGLK